LEGPSLSAACSAAFVAVLLVLAFLAFVIHLISLVFPARPRHDDRVLHAAIGAVVATRYAGARVSRVVEAP